MTLYWRPGCGYCVRLERALEASGLHFERRNIWEDSEAAATVRSYARGHETVPTVVIGEHGLVNPRVEQVLELVGAGAVDDA